MANIAEGFESSTAAEFNRFLGIAKASCAEVRSHFYVALDAKLIDQGQFNSLMRLGKSTAELVSGLKLSVMSRIELNKKGKTRKQGSDSAL